MKAIEVSGLKREFEIKIKEGSYLKSLFRPKYKKMKAVDGISFSVDQGEIVGFIGPNGAGKSTTIKMLTGILYPSSGEAKVLGMTPWIDRKKLAYKIGVIFGQRSQLWYHLPPKESFELLASIYKVDPSDYKQRLAELSKTFELDELMNVPVRKLSLGQRMRCEIAASFLHKPEIIFLDEPTIGLDVVAKTRIRELISDFNKRYGTTIFLTSHDVGDLEHLCKRVIVLNEGKIIFEGTLDALRNKFLRTKTIKIVMCHGQKLPALKNCKITTDQNQVTIVVDAKKSADVIAKVARLELEDITIEDPPMEDIIKAIYGKRIR